LLKVRWLAGGECVVFAEELEEIREDNKAGRADGGVVVPF
jgi:hypothetical protein